MSFICTFRGFSYDGQGPDAYFYAGDSGRPSGKGFQITNEKGSKDVLRVNYPITLNLKLVCSCVLYLHITVYFRATTKRTLF